MRFNKKGLVGKLLFLIFILIVLLICITAYQVYDVLNSIKFQTAELEKEVSELKNGDCSKISTIETRILILESKIVSACKNPLISFSVENYVQADYTCSNMESLKLEVKKQLDVPKKLCDIKTLNNFTENRIREIMQNVTLENYKEEARKNNISLDNYSEEEIKTIIRLYSNGNL